MKAILSLVSHYVTMVLIVNLYNTITELNLFYKVVSSLWNNLEYLMEAEQIAALLPEKKFPSFWFISNPMI